MSRYVHFVLDSATLPELVDALGRLGVTSHVGVDDEVALPPSLECAGELVEVACPAGAANTVEAFGFRLGTTDRSVQGVPGESRVAWARTARETAMSITLVCGDVDRRMLERELVPKLRFELAAARISAQAEPRGLVVERRGAEDAPRLVVRAAGRRSPPS